MEGRDAGPVNCIRSFGDTFYLKAPAALLTTRFVFPFAGVRCPSDHSHDAPNHSEDGARKNSVMTHKAHLTKPTYHHQIFGKTHQTFKG